MFVIVSDRVWLSVCNCVCDYEVIGYVVVCIIVCVCVHCTCAVCVCDCVCGCE